MRKYILESRGVCQCSKRNNLTFDQEERVTTKDGSETANYTFIEVGNVNGISGANSPAYSTNSTGKLSFLDNILVIFRGGQDESGNYALEQWPWKIVE